MRKTGTNTHNTLEDTYYIENTFSTVRKTGTKTRNTLTRLETEVRHVPKAIAAI